jgi:hypothetical protein
MQVGKPQSGDDGMRHQDRPMLLQALRTRDPDKLAEGFPRWDLRARQLGGGPFRGGLEVLQLEKVQIVRASGDRRLQTQGALPPGGGMPPHEQVHQVARPGEADRGRGFLPGVANDEVAWPSHALPA